MLEKNYDPQTIESTISSLWEGESAFSAGKGALEGAEAFCIVMPPPNVTGSLHMGHALNSTIQDIVIRFERLRQKNVLWQPGMDHAGIATQMVVERQLAAQNAPSRLEMGRERFVDKIWQWREESGGMIGHQLRRLGVSCDWSRERFTMDEGLSQAVRQVFVRLYKDGLIYKDKRLVNWDPKLKTAISDLEVEQKEVDGYLWHFRYALEGKDFNPEDKDSYITIATTRPETLLGDVAIAVNPNDKRYQHLIGRYAILPLVGRKLLIIADDYADLTVGSGAVKITPAHDFNDFEIGKRHNLRAINIMDHNACINLKKNDAFLEGLSLTESLKDLIEGFHGLERYEARKALIAKLEALGYLDHIEEHKHMVPFGDRGGEAIEPFLTEQWYVNAKELAVPALAAVKEGKTRFIPQNWEKTYFQWMENIQPWCISRQLWWGHQIPAWYGPDGHIFVEETEKEAHKVAQEFYNKSDIVLTRDEDVLDTWFSSALWPFSTLGWPEKTASLSSYYPTALLVTGFDIIFFWVARMMMMGLYFMEEVPFKSVYVHALVRDKFGAKMSKSKGNVIDPLLLIEEYGADALRFTLAIMVAQGRDVKLDPKRIEGYRNFATKLWNASRFAQMNQAKVTKAFDLNNIHYIVNRWILSCLSQVIDKVTGGIESYKFNEAASELYRFVWGSFCDWYIELTKPILMAQCHEAKEETQQVLAYCLLQIYKLLHPFMPFITEELWQKLPLEESKDSESGARSLLALQQWPNLNYTDESAMRDMALLIALIGDIRAVRKEMNVPASAMLVLGVEDADQAFSHILKSYDYVLKRLARIEVISWEKDPNSKGAAHCILTQPEGTISYYLPLTDFIDIHQEKARLLKEKAKIDSHLAKLEARLSNERFLANAAPAVIESDREAFAEAKLAQEKIIIALARL